MLPVERGRGPNSEHQFPPYYLPHVQQAQASMFLAIRTQGELTSLTAAVRSAIRNLDQDLPLFRVTLMEQLMADSMAQTLHVAML